MDKKELIAETKILLKPLLESQEIKRFEAIVSHCDEDDFSCLTLSIFSSRNREHAITFLEDTREMQAPPPDMVGTVRDALT